MQELTKADNSYKKYLDRLHTSDLIISETM